MSEILQQSVMALMLISMMFAMGLQLTAAELRSSLADRPVVATSIVLNFIVLPIVALGVVRVFGLSESASAGFLLCAAAPGATMTTLLSRNANANVPVAVGQLLLLVILSAFLTPVVAAQLFSSAGLASGTMNATGAVAYLLVIQVLPLVGGMLIRGRAPEKARKLEPIASRFATIVLVVVIVGMTLANGALVREVGYRGMVAMAAFLAIATASGLVVARPRATRVACSFAFGAQNIALATLLAKRYLDDEGLVTVLIFGLVTYLILLPLVPLFKRWIGAAPTTPPAQ